MLSFLKVLTYFRTQILHKGGDGFIVFLQNYILHIHLSTSELSLLSYICMYAYTYMCLWMVIYMRPGIGKMTPAKSPKESPWCSVIKPRRERKREIERERNLCDFTWSWPWMQLFPRICEHVIEIYFLDGARGEKKKSYGLTWRNIWCIDGVGENMRTSIDKENA